MLFRVTAITGPEEGRRVSRATVAMEDCLNKKLANFSFGSDLTVFMVLFVTAFDEPEENERWARGQTKLGRSHINGCGERIRIQSVGVPVIRAEMKYLSGSGLVAHLASAATSTFSKEPPKIAKGLNWPLLTQEVLSHVSTALPSAA